MYLTELKDYLAKKKIRFQERESLSGDPEIWMVKKLTPSYCNEKGEHEAGEYSYLRITDFQKNNQYVRENGICYDADDKELRYLLDCFAKLKDIRQEG